MVPLLLSRPEWVLENPEQGVSSEWDVSIFVCGMKKKTSSGIISSSSVISELISGLDTYRLHIHMWPLLRTRRKSLFWAEQHGAPVAWQSCVFSRKALRLCALGRKVVNNSTSKYRQRNDFSYAPSTADIVPKLNSLVFFAVFFCLLPGYVPPIPSRNMDTDHLVCWTDGGIDDGVLAHPCCLVQLQNMFKISLQQFLFLNDKTVKITIMWHPLGSVTCFLTSGRQDL